jgi:Protein of unknown function (DUF3105)
MTSPGARWAWRIGTTVAATAALAAMVAGPSTLVAGSDAGSGAGTHGSWCLPGREVPVMDSPHISPAEAGTVRYDTTPPTSGPHYPFTMAPGRYGSPVADGLTVHAMEHGHVVVHYAPGTPPDTVARLEHLARRHSRDVILAPHPGLATGIALTAWGRIDLLPGYDEPRIASFVERLRNRYVHGWQRPSDC